MSSPGSVYRRENGTWTAHVTWRVDGKRKQRKRGGFATEKSAQAELTRLMRSVHTGQAVAPDRTTVEQYLTEWIAHRRAMNNGKISTLQSYEAKINTYVRPAVGTLGLQQLTAVHLDRMYRGMANRGLSARSIRYVYSIVRKALSDAERKGLVEINVALKSSPPPARAAKAPRFTVWTPSELARFLAHIDGRPHALALRFAAYTGARRSEVCGLVWVDVDLDGATAVVREGVIELVGGGVHIDSTPKSHKVRELSLDGDLVARLRRHRVEQNEWRLVVGTGWRDRGLVFPGPDGEHLRPNVLTHTFRRYSGDANVPRIRLHDLRHTHATLLAEHGVDPATIRDRMGHASSQFSLDNYVHPAQTRQLAAANLFAGLIDDAGSARSRSGHG